MTRKHILARPKYAPARSLIVVAGIVVPNFKLAFRLDEITFVVERIVFYCTSTRPWV